MGTKYIDGSLDIGGTVTVHEDISLPGDVHVDGALAVEGILKNGRTFYNVASLAAHTDALKEIVIKTKIPFLNSNIMPLIHITGYAFGEASPVDLSVVFYIFNNGFSQARMLSSGGCTHPTYLSTYVDNEQEYVAVSLDVSEGYNYFTRFNVDFVDLWRNSTGRAEYAQGWTIETKLASEEGSIIPTVNKTEVTIAPIASSITGNAATATLASKAKADASGNNIVNTYQTKAEATTQLGNAKEYADKIVAEKDAYYQTEYLSWNRGALDLDAQCNAGIVMIANGQGAPSGSQYGTSLILPYRTFNQNSKPDFGAQIFMPNGDDPAKPDGLFYRTSYSGNWRDWQEVSTKNDIKYTYSGSDVTFPANLSAASFNGELKLDTSHNIYQVGYNANATAPHQGLNVIANGRLNNAVFGDSHTITNVLDTNESRNTGANASQSTSIDGCSNLVAGSCNYAAAGNSLVAGCWNTNHGDGHNTLIAGWDNVNSGRNNLLAGNKNKVMAQAMLVAGNENKVYGTYGTAGGYGSVTGAQNVVYSRYALVGGYLNTVGATKNADGSYAIDSTSATQGGNLVAGRGNTVKGECASAMGKENIVTHSYACAIGQGLVSQGNHHVLIGKYNQVNSTAYDIFTVGTGPSSTDRRTAFKVRSYATKDIINIDGEIAITPKGNGMSINGNVSATTFIGNLQGNALSATTATKLGSANVGGPNQPIYLMGGVPQACTYGLQLATFKQDGANISITPGFVQSGGDVTIVDGIITVNDDSHNHTIANVDGLQTELNELDTRITNIVAPTGAGWEVVCEKKSLDVINGWSENSLNFGHAEDNIGYEYMIIAHTSIPTLDIYELASSMIYWPPYLSIADMQVSGPLCGAPVYAKAVSDNQSVITTLYVPSLNAIIDNTGDLKVIFEFSAMQSDEALAATRVFSIYRRKILY